MEKPGQRTVPDKPTFHTYVRTCFFFGESRFFISVEVNWDY